LDAKDIIHLPDPRATVTVQVREVVRDGRDRPYVFRRVTLAGWHFPHRALEPFLLIGDAVSLFVLIARDETSAHAYFDRPLPHVRQISFGYGNVISWDFDLEIDEHTIARLDRGRLPKNVVDPF
jgi:hypothetical protein